MAKERLDVLLVNRRLADSREKAKAIIMAGCVFVNGQREDKAGSMFTPDVSIELKGMSLKYVSRGGFKLEKMIEKHSIRLDGMVCIDVGSSTGGFTDCMLQNGADKVYAIDSGTNQLAWKLRSDERVISMEQTNIRYVTPEDIGEEADFVSIDVAFISLLKVLLPVRELMKDGSEIVCLIKPQFEAGREQVGKKGVVRDMKVHMQVIEDVLSYAESIGFDLIDLDFSPIKGPEGNIEYLAYMKVIKENSRNSEIAGQDENGPDDGKEVTENTVFQTGNDFKNWGRLNTDSKKKLIADVVTEAHNSL
ncbi:MAG: TlyA family RNA methyltransferase [Lachnospiraceae bacterium]|nr:TlyA family RNA methyltransferase [Lachnospiraceae bacterium]